MFLLFITQLQSQVSILPEDFHTTPIIAVVDLHLQ